MGTTALEGTRVLDLGDFVSGPYCARLLGDLGAEVIKVEPPGGDSARRYGPFPGDVPDHEASGLFLYLNYNKLGITLDYRTPTGLALLGPLLAASDVVVLNADLGGRVDFGLDVQELQARYPRLIIVTITPFGLHGEYADYAGYDVNVAAVGAATSNPEEPDRAPLMPPMLQLELLSGLSAASTTMVAMIGRMASGHGQVVDFAQTQLLAAHAGSGLPTITQRVALAAASGGARMRGNYPSLVLRCKDGPVYLFAPQKEQWLRFVAAMGEPGWTKDPRFRRRAAMAAEYPEETNALVEGWLTQHTKRELLQIFLEHRVPCAPMLDAQDVLENDHLRERGFWQQIDHPVAGELTYPGFQFRLSATPMQCTRPAPLLGQHNAQVLCERLGLSPERLAQLRHAEVI